MSNRHDDVEEGGFQDYHDNKPKCTFCRSIIIGRVLNYINGKPYCDTCYNTIFPIGEQYKDDNRK